MSIEFTYAICTFHRGSIEINQYPVLMDSVSSAGGVIERGEICRVAILVAAVIERVKVVLTRV